MFQETAKHALNAQIPISISVNASHSNALVDNTDSSAVKTNLEILALAKPAHNISSQTWEEPHALRFNAQPVTMLTLTVNAHNVQDIQDSNKPQVEKHV